MLTFPEKDGLEEETGFSTGAEEEETEGFFEEMVESDVSSGTSDERIEDRLSDISSEGEGASDTADEEEA